ncbi:MAG: prepilin-type N-terminal cleavage/methylation domain-containing protein [Bdellovibrionaceae bacterium]|nr:prepilin-type N-terminal cleavage/methylation domain-containing protein [Pseudobdellovibrionaceae bacterium]
MKSSSASGFTLIEVLIAVAIMSTLGLLAAQTIKQAINQKKVIQEIVSDTSRLRDGMKIFEKDVQLAYHHRDWEKEIIDLAKKNKKATPAPAAPAGGAASGQPPQMPVFDSNGNLVSTQEQEANIEAPRKDPTTQFVGKENEIHFVTMNTGRILKDMPQADFVEVGYSLKECTSFEGKRSTKCIYRRVSPWVDEDVTKGGDEFVLVENVTEFNLRYLGRGKQDWNKDWRTDGGGDGATRGNFPWLVEVSVTYQKNPEKETSKKHSMQLVIPIHFPNNKEESGSSDSLGSGSATGGGPAAPTSPGGPAAPTVPSGAGGFTQ